jgi:ribosomal protein S14
VTVSDTFKCGHPRVGDNALAFKNGDYTSHRCRQCHNELQNVRKAAGRRALDFVIRLHVDGTLSEGQVATATGLSRIAIRELADAHVQRDVAA